MAAKSKKMCFGLIVGNRGFFPDELARDGRQAMINLLKSLGYSTIVLNKKDSKFGCVETWEEAKKCAALFKEKSEKIDGIIVTLPNFGDERGVADTIRLSGVDVPILVHAWPDDAKNMTIANRRDSFCGKISVTNNLIQYGIPFSLTKNHTMNPKTKDFEKDLEWFAAVCRVVNGLGKCRIGALGARPAAFNTVRYSEKLLADSGIHVETLDLSECFGRAEAMDDKDRAVARALAKIQEYMPTKGIPDQALIKMAKLAIVCKRWMKEYDLDITAVQCWTSLEEFYGVVPCTVMSMMSDVLQSSACEVDVCGAVSMHSLALASQTPSFLVDWNNNYGDDPDKCVCFHCSNLPKSCFKSCRMDYQAIIAGAVGKEKTYGTIEGRVKAGPMSYARISTLDTEGTIAAYVGEGKFTNDPLDTFGGYGVAEIPNLQLLLRHICLNGFEHHTAMSHSQSARAVYEAYETYLGWDVYWHQS